ncbi:MAG: heparinase II/III family protein [Gluconacetobacter diazotrophicus]|nr:heparinase II/III family protein [Gluconacetobacter diazotrophicus]
MPLRDWRRDARLSLARLPALAGVRIPEQPATTIRDLWPGDTARGARLVRGELVLGGASCALRPVQPIPPGEHGVGVPMLWPDPAVPPPLRAHAHGFSWLRDLRALGTDTARMRARALVSDWLLRPPADPAARTPPVIAERVNSWLVHHEFFAATADDAFRARLMSRLVIEARTLAALIPTPFHDHQALGCLKGLLACAVAIPDQPALLSRVMRHLGPEIGRQILSDGAHAERSPAAQLAALRELAEIKALMTLGQISQPLALPAALDRMSPVLRALRHGDGGLALFNGSRVEDPIQIDLALSQATRGRQVAASMPDGGFVRISSGRTLLLVDAGPPAPAGFDAQAHAGTLSFELSVGRERVITNCGTAVSPAWRDALRATAAHSTLAVADSSSSEFRGAAVVRRPSAVTVDHRQAQGAHWLDLSHDGYRPAFGAVHHRRIYVAEGGEDVRGEDRLDVSVGGDRPVPFALRFHLHPGVKVSRDSDDSGEEGGSALLSLPGGGRWRFRADGGRFAVEESIYLGDGTPTRASQLVIGFPVPEAAPEPVAAEPVQPPTDAAGDAAAEADAPPAVAEPASPAEPARAPVPVPASRSVRWALIRIDL